MRGKYIMFITVLVVVLPCVTFAQDTSEVKPVDTSKENRLVLVNRYMMSVENNRTMLLRTKPQFSQQAFRSNLKTPEVRFFNAADFYADGRFTCMPMTNWGHYQVPFHLNQNFVVYKDR